MTKSNHHKIVSNKFLRYLLIFSGTFFLAIGIIGIVIPILPTTPFLLLAAACYARSSKRFYKKLIQNKWFGNYIKNYQQGKGIPLKVKIYAITLLWATILASSLLFFTNLLLKILLISIAVLVSIHILTIKTHKK